MVLCVWFQSVSAGEKASPKVVAFAKSKLAALGNDPIIVDDYWMSDSLLNFKLKYWGSNQIHFLNLVKQPGDVLEENQPIELELRHNANDDDEAIPYTAFVSFSLNALRIEGLDSVSFVVTSTDYDGGEFLEEGVFNYSDLNETE